MTRGFAAALLLADARFPAGGHAHSGGVEPAAATGVLTDLPALELFLRGRLRTAGVTAAGLAAAACHQAAVHDKAVACHETAARNGSAARNGTGGGPAADWALLDAEADARMPSPAQREASRRQGRALLRAVRAAWNNNTAWENILGRAPHHPIVLGAAAHAAGLTPGQAARIAAYQSVSGPAGAAVRLLGLDPIAVSALVARLAPEIDRAAPQHSAGPQHSAAHQHGAAPYNSAAPRNLPYPSAPNLDLLAEFHLNAEVRLFES